MWKKCLFGRNIELTLNIIDSVRIFKFKMNKINKRGAPQSTTSATTSDKSNESVGPASKKKPLSPITTRKVFRSVLNEIHARCIAQK